jgi:hypothetical protein
MNDPRPMGLGMSPGLERLDQRRLSGGARLRRHQLWTATPFDREGANLAKNCASSCSRRLAPAGCD